MPVYEINGQQPVIGDGTWIAPSADIIGNVKIGANCYIGFGAVIRGDFGSIVIGDGTLVEDNVVIHVGTKAEIGNRVIIGHMAMIHDAVIKDCSLIGMMSMICDGAVIDQWTIIAEQSLVKKNQRIPREKIYAGSPAREIGDLTERHKEGLVSGQQVYMDLIADYAASFKRVD
jgi:phenylacetic acid degradation protein